MRMLATNLALFLTMSLGILEHPCFGTENLEIESVLIRRIDEIEIPAKVSGVLAKMVAKEGQHLKSGTAFAKVDDTEARILLEKAKVDVQIATHAAENDVVVRIAEQELEFARQRLERLQRADSRRPGSVQKSELDEAEHRVAQAKLEQDRAEREIELARESVALKESELKLSNQKIRDSIIRSPLAGMVVELLKREGEWVEIGEPVVRILRVDKFRAEGMIPASRSRKKLLGSPVEVVIRLGPGGEPMRYSGKVVFLHPEVNPVNSMMRIWADIDNHDGVLTPGLRGTMAVYLEDESDVKQLAETTRTKAPAEAASTAVPPK